ncbi:hypothetical protein [Clostridium baratii]|uniref:hypothetical protein n=1 Tax=Clostridium baratii TaxID=1561 RepID=UPI00290182D2|nr:hypothetical protein [Clostridium baratii]MDU1053325.1 hypothetical protein [Clostridium baratii]
MYCNLEAEIARKKIKKPIIAEAIGKTYNTLNLKIAGKYPFTYDEALIIQEEFFPEVDLKELFKKTELQQKVS